jgi:hypothetical protein
LSSHGIIWIVAVVISCSKLCKLGNQSSGKASHGMARGTHRNLTEPCKPR